MVSCTSHIKSAGAQNTTTGDASSSPREHPTPHRANGLTKLQDAVAAKGRIKDHIIYLIRLGVKVCVYIVVYTNLFR